MESSQSDLDRLLMMEHARKTAELAYAQNPLDADNLTKWGGALLELAGFQSPAESVEYCEVAKTKLEEALQIDPERHETLWCLGNAYTSHGFYTKEHETAVGYFAKATQYFQQATTMEPTNELYQKSLDLSLKAPELHIEFHKQMEGQSAAVEGPSASKVKASKKKKKKDNDLTYDILGWVILAVGVFAWVGMAKSTVPPPSTR